MRCLVYFATFALFACSEPPPIDGDITGHWYGQRWDGRARVIWLNHRDADGRLVVEFQRCFNGVLLSGERQEGTSQLRDGVYETVIESTTWTDADGETSNVSEDAIEFDYRVLQLTDEVMSYVNNESGESFDVVRVAADFTLECPPATRSISTNPGGRKGQDAWIVRGDPSDDDEAADDAAGDDQSNEVVGQKTRRDRDNAADIDNRIKEY